MRANVSNVPLIVHILRMAALSRIQETKQPPNTFLLSSFTFADRI